MFVDFLIINVLPYATRIVGWSVASVGIAMVAAHLTPEATDFGSSEFFVSFGGMLLAQLGAALYGTDIAKAK
jgi:hypothetical protein